MSHLSTSGSRKKEILEGIVFSDLLEALGVTQEDQERLFLDCHVVAEDDRYPLFCVNGDLNFGAWINAETGSLEGKRVCICSSRSEDFCICDLNT